jgi:hypothetical protein
VVASACEQSGRARLPEIVPALPLPTWLDGLADDGALRLALLPEAGRSSRELRFTAAGGLLVVGWSLPVMFERMGEVLGGGLLIVLGGIGLWAVRAGRIYGHSHRHGSETAAHWHLHLGRPERHPLATAHSHLPTLVGAAFALSSVRALTMLAPFGDRLGQAPLVTLLALIVVFGVGILLSMSLFGVAFARVMSAAAAARLGQAAGLFMALTSIGLGVFWIVTA